MKNFLVVPDIHLDDKIPYGDFVQDKRIKERENVFEQIYSEIRRCNIDDVILVGDVTDKRNPSTHTYDLLFEFLSNIRKNIQFGGRIFIVVGNHDSSLSLATLSPLNRLLQELNIIVIDKIMQVDDYVFLPYQRKQNYQVGTNEELRDKVMEDLGKLNGEYLFSHITISNFTVNGQDTSLFDEMVLDKSKLGSMYKYVFNGHIHEHSKSDNVINVGNLFTSIVDDTSKMIYMMLQIDLSSYIIDQKRIIKIENPEVGEILSNEVYKNNILKVLLTKQYTVEELESIKKELEECYGYQLIEKSIVDRSKKIVLENGKNVTDLSLEELVDLFGKQKGIDQNLLKKGLTLIK